MTDHCRILYFFGQSVYGGHIHVYLMDAAFMVDVLFMFASWMQIFWVENLIFVYLNLVDF